MHCLLAGLERRVGGERIAGFLDHDRLGKIGEHLQRAIQRSQKLAQLKQFLEVVGAQHQRRVGWKGGMCHRRRVARAGRGRGAETASGRLFATPAAQYLRPSPRLATASKPRGLGRGTGLRARRLIRGGASVVGADRAARNFDRQRLHVEGNPASVFGLPTCGVWPGVIERSAPYFCMMAWICGIELDLAVRLRRSDRVEAADRHDARGAVVKFVGLAPLWPAAPRSFCGLFRRHRPVCFSGSRPLSS